jgi:acetylornithine deacetylase
MKHEKLKQRVTERIDAQSEEMVSFLGDMIDKKTVIGNERPGQEVVVDKFESMGLEPDVWTPDVEKLREHEAFFETQNNNHGQTDSV